jgi:hypothetical protein
MVLMTITSFRMTRAQSRLSPASVVSTKGTGGVKRLAGPSHLGPRMFHFEKGEIYVLPIRTASHACGALGCFTPSNTPAYDRHAPNYQVACREHESACPAAPPSRSDHGSVIHPSAHRFQSGVSVHRGYRHHAPQARSRRTRCFDRTELPLRSKLFPVQSGSAPEIMPFHAPHRRNIPAARHACCCLRVHVTCTA